MIEGEEKSKNTQKRRKTNSQGATIQHNSATSTLLLHRIMYHTVLYGIQVGVEWRGILNSRKLAKHWGGEIQCFVHHVRVGSSTETHVIQENIQQVIPHHVVRGTLHYTYKHTHQYACYWCQNNQWICQKECSSSPAAACSPSASHSFMLWIRRAWQYQYWYEQKFHFEINDNQWLFQVQELECRIYRSWYNECSH